MTFLEALYGSQYHEITSKGKDGSKGRFNGNLFLSAFVIICLFLLIAVLSLFVDDFSDKTNQLFHQLFGYSSGKTIGKLLAVPLLALIYLMITKTVGSERNYERITKIFSAYSEEEKQKATKKVLLPFLIILGLLLLFALIPQF
jgi:Ca2+/Na+ antiporter